ncbi:hypothetical protein IX321_002476 [Bacteroides pyogenes]|uniref:Uncharacterized protein n=1 Tax=Bacteroides pyogenes JCM 6292 TaxID=1235809 RepID=W4P846_9BACE|nr:hypothetical protein [Bacteroides pyogenes]GAE15593.1 hypothetical protein JCM6292_1893 [Bacteroides pyogenes JCM 6292]MBR8718560.1 hypothetical protein [Bacteroides pyogenes]MBR8748010.1 hypothetical protein [Bacteroides pyogenes]MBR8758302.1 hypothetical protein [Bacteroides pyogenes]
MQKFRYQIVSLFSTGDVKIIISSPVLRRIILLYSFIIIFGTIKVDKYAPSFE